MHIIKYNLRKNADNFNNCQSSKKVEKNYHVYEKYKVTANVTILYYH